MAGFTKLLEASNKLKQSAENQLKELYSIDVGSEDTINNKLKSLKLFESKLTLLQASEKASAHLAQRSIEGNEHTSNESEVHSRLDEAAACCVANKLLSNVLIESPAIHNLLTEKKSMTQERTAIKEQITKQLCTFAHLDKEYRIVTKVVAEREAELDKLKERYHQLFLKYKDKFGSRSISDETTNQEEDPVTREANVKQRKLHEKVQLMRFMLAQLYRSPARYDWLEDRANLLQYLKLTRPKLT